MYLRLEILFFLALISSNCTPPSTGLEHITGKKALASHTKFKSVLSEIVRFLQ